MKRVNIKYGWITDIWTCYDGSVGSYKHCFNNYGTNIKRNFPSVTIDLSVSEQTIMYYVNDKWETKLVGL